MAPLTVRLATLVVDAVSEANCLLPRPGFVLQLATLFCRASTTTFAWRDVLSSASESGLLGFGRFSIEEYTPLFSLDRLSLPVAEYSRPQ